MAFDTVIAIPQTTLEKFAQVKLPSDFQAAYLKKSDDVPNRFINYDILLRQGGVIHKAGNISVTKRLLEPFVKDKNGLVRQLKGSQWDRHIMMYDSKNPNDQRYSRYGLTMAALYKFTEELAKNNIEKTLSIIKEDNIPSIEFSAKLNAYTPPPPRNGRLRQFLEHAGK